MADNDRDEEATEEEEIEEIDCQCVSTDGCRCEECDCFFKAQILANAKPKPLLKINCMKVDNLQPYETEWGQEITPVEEEIDGVKFEVKLTVSGLLNINTESPQNAMDTYVHKTKSGNIEIVTTIHRYNEQSDKKHIGFCKAKPKYYDTYWDRQKCKRTARKLVAAMADKFNTPNDCQCEACTDMGLPELVIRDVEMPVIEPPPEED